ncbi:hypothetical protein PDQ75_00790 [Bacillus cereus group sp. Bc015]|uniref:hypothetical protein n=1 Tax=Bacillus cereus group sp. Bc015 TaxID=3018123 RepID=UPI0022E4DA94|nr:hypothetical protein [Bacillus cereus group sp. Bc015]MDA2733681.1 hypothetical protein [Bacillus cereus group sp. Bc015]
MLINDDETMVGNVAQTNEGKAKTKLQKLRGNKWMEKTKKMCEIKSLENTAYPFRKKQKISCNNGERCVYINGTNWPNEC